MVIINIIINGDALLWFQLVYFAACLPAFLFQFIPFMRRYKIQRVIFVIYLYLAFMYNCYSVNVIN